MSGYWHVTYQHDGCYVWLDCEWIEDEGPDDYTDEELAELEYEWEGRDD